MTNYEILTLLQRACDRTKNMHSFFGQLHSVADKNERVIELVTAIAGFDGSQPSCLLSLKNELNQVRVDLENLSSRYFFECTFKLSGILNRLVIDLPAAERPITKLLKHLNQLQDSYDDYTRQHSTTKIMAVVMRTARFLEELDLFNEYVEFISVALASDQKASENSGTFDLYMPATLTFEDFISRLNSINIIYEELCQILAVSANEEPLRIIKVESGSLWAKLFGNSKVMALMDDLLRGGANYLHRNYTTEGKVGTIPSSIKTMDEVLKFSKKLEATGIDVTQIHDQLAKGTLLIAKNMNSLFESQASVVINGETIELEKTDNKKLLNGRSIQKLRDGTSEE